MSGKIDYTKFQFKPKGEVKVESKKEEVKVENKEEQIIEYCSICNNSKDIEKYKGKLYCSACLVKKKEKDRMDKETKELEKAKEESSSSNVMNSVEQLVNKKFEEFKINVDKNNDNKIQMSEIIQGFQELKDKNFVIPKLMKNIIVDYLWDYMIIERARLQSHPENKHLNRRNEKFQAFLHRLYATILYLKEDCKRDLDVIVDEVKNNKTSESYKN